MKNIVAIGLIVLILVTFLIISRNVDIDTDTAKLDENALFIKKNDIGKENTEVSLLDVNVEPQTHPDLSSEVNTNDDFIISCESSKTYEEHLNEFKNNAQNHLKSFKDSTVKEHKLAYILSNTNAKELSRVESLKKFVDEFPQSKLGNWMLLTACGALESNRCDDSLELDAITENGDNAALWFNIANLRAKRNDIEGVVGAIQEGLTAPHYNEYWSEQVALVENVLQDTTPLSYIERVIGAMEVAGGGIWHADVLDFCREHSNRVDIAEACLGLGEKLAKTSKTIILKIFGLAIQDSFYKAHNNDSELVALREQTDKLNEWLTGKSWAKANKLKLYDENLTRGWIEKVKSEGELAASEYVIEEALRLSRDNNYNPCPKS